MSRGWKKRRLDVDLHAKCGVLQNEHGESFVTVDCHLPQSYAYMSIYLRGDRIEVSAAMDWNERRKLLKVHFESNVLCEDALHEIQFGHVKRPCHDSHPFAADRYESCSNRWTALCEENRGFAILQAGSRAVSTGRCLVGGGGEIALSLLRAPLVPDDTADRWHKGFSYAIMPFATGFKDAGVVKAGMDFVEPGRMEAGFHMDSDAVVLETVKPADDQSDAVILRLYESLRTHAAGTLVLPFEAQVYESSMDESETGALIGEGREVCLTMKPFEIRTLRIVRK